MATKSFTTEYKLNNKSSNKLIDALNKSKRVDHQIKQKVTTIREINTINSIMSKVKKRHGE